MALPNSIDVVIVGGGPAGLAASLALRAKGLDVLVADGASSDPIDKACGEGLMPDAVRALAELGVDARAAEHWPFKGIRFLGSGSEVSGCFTRGGGLGVRRTALHRTMVHAAEATGVRLAWNSPAVSIKESVVEFTSGRVQARWIIGADGGLSAVRRQMGLNVGMRVRNRFGFRKHFRVEPWSEFVEVYWGDCCQIYVTAVGPNEIGVAVVSRDRRLRVDEAVARFEGLARRLKGVPAISAERGGVSATRRLRRVSAGHVALIGDASGSVDAVTGEGLNIAFRQAQALAVAIARGDLRHYESAHARIGRMPALMSDVLLLLDGWAGLRNRVLPALARRPQIFEGMLAGHTGNSHPATTAVNLASLGWAILF